MMVRTTDQISSQSIPLSNLKLWIVKIHKFDVCGRPLVANPVTYYTHFDMLQNLLMIHLDKIYYISTDGVSKMKDKGKSTIHSIL